MHPQRNTSPLAQAREILNSAQPQETAAVEPEPVETLDAEPVETELETGEVDTEGLPLDAGEAPVDDDEGVDIGDIHQLAEAIGVDADYIYGLKIPMPDGDPITLGEYKDLVQQKGQVGSDEERLTLERNLFEQERQQAQSQFNTQIQQMQQVPQQVIEAEARAQALAYQYQNTDWAAQEQSNPGQAALDKQNLSTAFQQAQSDVQEAKGQQQQLIQQNTASRRQQEEQKLLLAIDEWRKPDERKKGIAVVSQLMVDYGFAPNEIDNVMDHRAIRIMHDLARYKAQAGEGSVIAKKVKQVPKALRPGGRVSKVKKTALKTARENLRNAKRGGRRQAEIDVAKALLTG